MRPGIGIWLSPVLMLCLALFASKARADGQEFCNETSFILYTAIGFPDQASLVSEGWTRLRPGECRTVFPAPVPPGEYFVFARSSAAHRGGVRQWSGPTNLCVDINNFSVSGLANCENLGLESRGFHVIDGNAPRGRKTIFIETGEYAERAGLAGLQRLLADNGFDVRKIDGYAGRRTRIAVTKFLKQTKLSERPADPDLIDLMEQTARKVITKTGLEVCNQADGLVWTSFAHRKNKQWETRGWWSVTPGTCIQLISDDLGKRAKYYLYAGLINPDGETALLDAKETFCVAEVKFSIFGRHDCVARGYLQSRFRKIEISKGPLTRISLTPEDFGDATFAVIGHR